MEVNAAFNLTSAGQINIVEIAYVNILGVA